MKILVDKIIQCEKKSPITTASIDREDKITLENFVLTRADCYFWGDFQNNSRQGSPLPIKVIIPVDFPRDAKAYPAWNTLVVSYNNPELQIFEAVIIVRLAEINRLTGCLKIIALFDSKKHNPIGCKEGEVSFDSVFDFYQNIYLIELDLLNADVEDVSNIAYKIGLLNNFVDDEGN